MLGKTAEEQRISQGRDQIVPPWLRWGPYVSERSWGTVREDYSFDGNAWSYFPYELAIKKAYRWGEDGIAGWCDRYQILVLAPAFWNKKDPHLKERLFGLTIYEGNHGEDVKEYYYHLDGVPSHAYMKYVYKYPQAEFPYQKLRDENRNRGRDVGEYELVDTGVFNENRYFDIVIEYAKESEEVLCIQVEVFNRGPEKAPFHLLMQLFFRNQWSWWGKPVPKPVIIPGEGCCLVADEAEMSPPSNLAAVYRLGKRYLYGPEGAELLFTENETHFDNQPGYFKDAFHRKVVNGENVTNPQKMGSKAALHYIFDAIAPGGSAKILFYFTDKPTKDPLKNVEKTVALRKKEADAFFDTVHPPHLSEDEKKIQRQAIAGQIWSKQIYLMDVDQWLKGDNDTYPPPESRFKGRNIHWRHLNSMRILLMPDKWEYPWFAAWDHAFHCLTYSLVDLEFAKEQLWYFLFDQFQHPNGQIPAYEWDFSDLNPPVHAWAILRIFHAEEQLKGKGKADRYFLEKCFHKLILNFTWWVNKVDNSGNNVFEGGFLGLDNITMFDRSEKMPGGAVLQQSDGTGWMAMFCLNLMRIALVLSDENKTYEGLATKFFQHYVYIAHAMKKRGNRDYEMWSETDGFFYDVLTYPNGTFNKFRVRSLVGIIPLFAIEILNEDTIKNYTEFYTNFQWFMNNRKDLVEACIIPTHRDGKKHYICALMNGPQLTRVLKYVWDPNEFRATYGLRSMSRYHEKHPVVFQDKQVGYEPAESHHAVKGGNSNWRGPIWMPTTFLLVDSLRKLSEAFGDEIKIQVGSETPVTMAGMAESFANRVINIFSTDASGRRPIFGPEFPFSKDPYWKDLIPFNEYYNPETGKGLGASHQTGWSALVANFIAEYRH